MRFFSLLIVCSVVSLTACKGKTKSDTAAMSASAAVSAAPSVQREAADRETIPLPSGPVFAILRGQGIGPIRFGATVKTVERHMQAPCDQREENLCRYIGRAAEFLFDSSGALSEIRLHRVYRSAGAGSQQYGMFNGRFPEGVQFGMLPHAIRELLGEPKQVQPVSAGGPPGVVEIFHYDDMRLEFDKMPSGDVVLGGVTLLRPAAAPGASAAPSAAPAPSR